MIARMNAIEVRNLSKIYSGKIKAINDLSFDVEEGKIFGFLGPNGAGKSTTIKVLVTLTDATLGSAKIFGVDVSKEPAKVRGMIGYVPQDISADGALTGYENLLLSAKLYDIHSRERAKRIEDVLATLGLSERAHDIITTYSGGMVRRLEIGQAMLHRPRVLFLDEPTIGLDPSGRKLVWAHIKKLNKAWNVTIFLTTHYMEEAEVLCENVGIINQGKLAVIGTPNKLKEMVGAGTLTTVLDLAPKLQNYNGGAQAVANARNFLSNALIGLAESVTFAEGKWQFTVNDIPTNAPKVLQKLMSEGVVVKDLELKSPTLEDAFLKFTGSRLGESRVGRGEWRALRGRRRTVRRLG